MLVSCKAGVLGCSRGPLGASRAPKHYVLKRILKNQQNRYPKIDPRARPTFDIPVGLFCDTYEKARIAKAGNFDVPVGEVKFEEKVRGVRNGSNVTPVVVSSENKAYRLSDEVTRKSYL